MIMESGNVEGFATSTTELKPHWRYGGQFGTKHFGNIISMSVPLQGKTIRVNSNTVLKTQI